MSESEILKRFRQVTLAYVIVAVTLIAGLAVDWNQTQDIKATQHALVHDTTALANAIANGQTYLCNQIAALSGETSPVPGTPQKTSIRCFTQQQRYQQIIASLESH